MARGGRHQATSYPVVKICVWVGRDDWQWMQSRHPYAASDVLRRLIGDYRRTIEGLEPREFEELTAVDLEGL
jgi:hypothetical protein